MALRDLAQKDTSPQGPPPLVTTPYSTPVQPEHPSPSLKRNPALFPEDRGPRERGSPEWRAEEQKHKDTHGPGKDMQMKTNMHAHYTDTQALPSARGLGGQVWDQSYLPPYPGPFLIWQQKV